MNSTMVWSTTYTGGRLSSTEWVCLGCCVVPVCVILVLHTPKHFLKLRTDERRGAAAMPLMTNNRAAKAIRARRRRVLTKTAGLGLVHIVLF